MRGSKASFKYNKITPQQKFHLLSLVIAQKMLIKEAALIVGINYSTAKTILFFHRNGDASYQFELPLNPSVQNKPKRPQAMVVELEGNSSEEQGRESRNPVIRIVSTIGSRKQSIHLAKLLATSHDRPASKYASGKQSRRRRREQILREGIGQEGLREKEFRPMTRSQAAFLANKGICKHQFQSQQLSEVSPDSEESSSQCPMLKQEEE